MLVYGGVVVVLTVRVSVEVVLSRNLVPFYDFRCPWDVVHVVGPTFKVRNTDMSTLLVQGVPRVSQLTHVVSSSVLPDPE